MSEAGADRSRPAPPARLRLRRTAADSAFRERGPRFLAWPEAILLLIIAGICAWQLLVPPLVGLADNGD